MVLSIAMLTSMGSVFAEDVGSDTDYVVTYSAEEITDFDVLLEMALEQQANSNSHYAQDETAPIQGEQLLEIRQYADGHKENSYVNFSISAIDNNGVPLSAAQLLAYIDEGSDSYYGVNVLNRTYYSAYYDNITLRPYAKLDSTQATVTYSGSGVTPISAEIMYMYNGPNDCEVQTYSCSVATVQTFTSYFSNQTYFTVCHPNKTVTSQVKVTLSNGSYLTAFACARFIAV